MSSEEDVPSSDTPSSQGCQRLVGQQVLAVVRGQVRLRMNDVIIYLAFSGVGNKLLEVEVVKPTFLISEPLATEPFIDGPHSGNAVRVKVGLLAGRRQGLLRGQAVLVAEELFLGPPSHVRHHATSSPEVASDGEVTRAIGTISNAASNRIG